MKKYYLLASCSLLLSGCITGPQEFPEIKFPTFWQNADSDETDPIDPIIEVETQSLENWWLTFEDPALNSLIEIALSDSPDRLIAQSRIIEARGIKRSARSTLFPQIGLSGDTGREDSGISGADDFYDAGFDASFEIDVFGKNRKNVEAADANIIALEAQYQDVTLTLIADIVRNYIQYRGYQKQSAIAYKNLRAQEQTLELVTQQFEVGEAPELDVERSTTITNTTRASIPEFERLAYNARLQLSVLTGQLPEDLLGVLSDPMQIPGGSAVPVLVAPAQVLSLRPDIRAASANLAAQSAIAQSISAELLPTFSLSGFFGITQSALTSSTMIWNTAVGAAVSVLDFGLIEGQIDAARAREVQAYQQYRKTILSAVSEVETALSDASKLNKRRVSLYNAAQSADAAYTIIETLYKEGEISFLDLLDAQRTVNETDSALIAAETEQAESLVRLYKSLGVY